MTATSFLVVEACMKARGVVATQRAARSWAVGEGVKRGVGGEAGERDEPREEEGEEADGVEEGEGFGAEDEPGGGEGDGDEEGFAAGEEGGVAQENEEGGSEDGEERDEGREHCRSVFV